MNNICKNVNLVTFKLFKYTSEIEIYGDEFSDESAKISGYVTLTYNGHWILST